MWKCLECKKQFTVKVGTIFEDSPISLDKWMLAMWMLANCKNGINSYEIARDLSVTQKTAWFMLQRLRHAMLNGTFEKMTGEIEADETYIGGRAKNMHKSRLAKNPVGTGGQGKTIVLGFRNRGGDVKAEIIPDAMQVTLRRRVKETVEAGSTLYTDFAGGYRGLDSVYDHQIVDHAIEYVRGRVHTNGIENFWSLLKRTLKGTYVSVEPFHLLRYIAEQTFRYNERKLTDGERFQLVLEAISGKRLTWNTLTSQEAG